MHLHNRSIILSFVLFLGCICSGQTIYAQQMSAQNITTGQFTDKRSGLMFTCPTAWQIEVTDYHQWIHFRIHIPKAEGQKFDETISLSKQHVSAANTSLSSIVRGVEDDVIANLPKSKIISSKEITVNGLKCMEIEFTGEMEKEPMHWKKLFFIRESKLYTFTFICLEKRFKQLMVQANTVLYSIKTS
jgi:hypothetical protein